MEAGVHKKMKIVNFRSLRFEIFTTYKKTYHLQATYL
jgi:uncharacterized protein YggL (DUF469 family)